MKKEKQLNEALQKTIPAIMEEKQALVN